MMTESSALAIAFSGYVNNPMLAYRKHRFIVMVPGTYQTDHLTGLLNEVVTMVRARD